MEIRELGVTVAVGVVGGRSCVITAKDVDCVSVKWWNHGDGAVSNSVFGRHRSV